jgi:hypothetical protein
VENGKYECDDCGDVTSDIHDAPDGRHLCDDCFYDEYENCQQCGEVVDKDEIIFVHTAHVVPNGFTSRAIYYEEPLCEACRDRLGYHQCVDCGEHYLEDEMSRYNHVEFHVMHHDWICSQCFDDHYFMCDRCEEIFPEDERGSGDLCRSCADGSDDGDDDVEDSERRVRETSRRIADVTFRHDPELDKITKDPESEI